MAKNWNPWHGCQKFSEGCRNCYVYRGDAKHGRDASLVYRTNSFAMPTEKKRDGSYKLPESTLVWTCFTSDFFLEEADPWREEAWAMIKESQDLRFFFITKRIHRFYEVIPRDWDKGYPNVAVGCTMENQKRADERLPIFKEAPILDKTIICEPLLSAIDLRSHLGSWVDEVVAGGESGASARPCNYQWVLSLADQCGEKKVPFWFKQTGANFIKDGKSYIIPRKSQHTQARKANISFRRTDKDLSK